MSQLHTTKLQIERAMYLRPLLLTAKQKERLRAISRLFGTKSRLQRKADIISTRLAANYNAKQMQKVFEKIY